MKTTLTPISYCPECDYRFTVASDLTDAPNGPSAGDISICINCGEVLEFNDILVAVRAEQSTINSIPRDQWLLIRDAVDAIRARGRLVKKPICGPLATQPKTRGPAAPTKPNKCKR